MVRGDEGRPGDLLELRHRRLSHRDHPAWLRRAAHRDRPQAGMGWAKHERHKRTHGCAVCEAPEPHRLGGLSHPTHNLALSMNRGSWRAPTTSMPCIGTMNPSGSCHRYGVPPSGGPDRLKPGLQTGGSWKTPTTFVPCIGTLNPPLTPPRRGTVRTRRNAYSPLGRG